MPSVVTNFLRGQKFSNIGELAVAKIMRRNLLADARENSTQHAAKNVVGVRKYTLISILIALILSNYT